MSFELNDEQIFATYQIEDWFHRGDKQVFELSGAAGTGKAIPLNTLLPTPNGFKKLSELKIGDYLFGKNGNKVKIKGIYPQGVKRCYEIKFSDGRIAKCSKDHIWHVLYIKDNIKIEKDMTLEEILMSDYYNSYDYRSNPFYVPIAKSIPCDENPNVSNLYEFGKSNPDYIPNELIFTSEEQRWELVRGLFDSDRASISCKKINNISYCSNNYELLLTIRRLINSLGYCALISDVHPVYKTRILTLKVNKNEKELFFKNPSNKEIVSYVPTNKENSLVDMIVNKYTDDEIFKRISIQKITNLGSDVSMACVYVDSPDHLFLMNDFIVTHNTTVVKYVIERLGLKLNQVLFMAFQGKAVSRMVMSGLPAKTIHSAIYDIEKTICRDEEGNIIYKENGKPKTNLEFFPKRSLGKKIKLIVIDEASMVSKKLSLDILHFNLPVIALGDLNQLQPVFGESYFLEKPDFTLTKIMRQQEGDPIIYLAQEILKGHKLRYGVYGKSAVIRKSDLSVLNFQKANCVITGTNELRHKINKYYREYINRFDQLDFLHIGEKVVCRKNNWSKMIGKGIFLTNGTSGFIDNVNHEEYKNNQLSIDFRPDFTDKVFRKVNIDYKHLIEYKTSNNDFNQYVDKFEFAYALTLFSVQGSEWDNVLFLNENFMKSFEDRKRFVYTGITRARKSIIIVQ